MGDCYRLGYYYRDNSTTTATVTDTAINNNKKNTNSSNIIMSPRSVKSSTFDDDVDDDYATILLQVGDGLENANPMSRCTKTTTCTTTTTSTIICQDHVVEPPLVPTSNSTIHSCPPSATAPMTMIAANKSSDCGSSSMGTVAPVHATTTTTTLRAAAKATCQRRVIFPTYPRTQQQQPSSSDGSVPLEVTTTTTTASSSFTLPIKTMGSSPTSPLGPRRASVLPSVFPSLAPTSVTPQKPAASRPKPAPRLHVTLAASCTTTTSSSSSSQTTPTGSSGKRSNSGRSCSDDLLKHLLHGGPPPTPAPGRPRRILALPATTHHTGNNNNDSTAQPPPPPVKNEPRHRCLAAPSTSLLRREPRYSPRHMATTDTTAAEEEASVLVEAKSEGSSLPSLVDIKNEDGNNTDDDEDDDDDDDCSQPSTGKKVVSTTTITGGEHQPSTMTDDETTLQQLANSPPPPPPTKRTTTSAAAACRVGFDPRIWIREFHRAPEEATCTWYTDDDMDSFRRLALDRILRYQGFYEIIPTGTGRTVQRRTLAGDPNDPSRRPTPWRGPIYSHAALTLDGENCNDVYMREKVLEKELCSILVVDPQELCCKLFAKALQAALPYASTTVVTANSSAEALKHLAQGKRFDLIIVEERLQLFQNHRNPQHIRTSSSTSYFASSSSTAVSSPAKNHASSKSFLSWPLANNNDGSKDTGNQNNPDASPATGSFATIMVSGAALIRTLRQFPVTSYSLLIGVTAHLDHDGPKFKECGADFCWPKPPPPLNKGLLDEMVKTLLIKRGQEVLANELFG